MYAELLAFFTAVCNKDAELCRGIVDAEADLHFNEGELVFSLVGLYQVLSLQPGFPALGYAEFRRRLYASRLNSDLALMGAQIVVMASSGKVDSSLYRLTQRSTSIR
jgi:hypothetical protein|tara:strand:- start:1530 stop:1850 length:321 start_codon:yes stop_codon:yes gene_type:complete